MAAITAVLDVRFSDCDPMGHVNNANYLTYFEQARVEFLRHHHLGWTLPFILAEANVRFLAPARFGDTLHVHLTVGHIGTHAAPQFLFRKLNYDPVKDFAPVTLLTISGIALAVHSSVPATNLKIGRAHV